MINFYLLLPLSRYSSTTIPTTRAKLYRKGEEDTQIIYKVIKEEETPNICQQVAKSGVDYQKLYRRYHGKNSKSTCPLINRRLDPIGESLLEEYIRRIDLYGLGLLLKGLEVAVYDILKQRATVNHLSNLLPLQLPAFCERHLGLLKIKQ